MNWSKSKSNNSTIAADKILIIIHSIAVIIWTIKITRRKGTNNLQTELFKAWVPATPGNAQGKLICLIKKNRHDKPMPVLKLMFTVSPLP